MPLNVDEMLEEVSHVLEQDHHFEGTPSAATVVAYRDKIIDWMLMGFNEYTIADLISDEVDEAAKGLERETPLVSSGNATQVIPSVFNTFPTPASQPPPSRQILHNYTSAEVSFIQYDYPFGFNLRCLRRVWLEQATKGAKRGEWRFAAQTTERKWNHLYTEIGAPKGKDFLSRTTIPFPVWNKLKYSTYEQFALLYLDYWKTDEQGAPWIQHAGIGYYAGPDAFYLFYDQWWSQMTEEERQQFLKLIKRSVRGNGPVYWAEKEDKMARHELTELLRNI